MLKLVTPSQTPSNWLAIYVDDEMLYRLTNCRSEEHDFTWSNPKVPKLTAGQIRFVAHTLTDMSQNEHPTSVMSTRSEDGQENHVIAPHKNIDYLLEIIKEADGRELPYPSKLAA